MMQIQRVIFTVALHITPFFRRKPAPVLFSESGAQKTYLTPLCGVPNPLRIPPYRRQRHCQNQEEQHCPQRHPGQG
jgi:hypothetical protein